MAMNVTAMMTTIIKKLPDEWQAAWVIGESWYNWVEAMFTDFITMWGALVLLPGTIASHAHSLVTPGPFLPITTAMAATGYTGSPTGITTTYYNTLATEVATHFNTPGVVVTNIASTGAVLHDHIIAVPPQPLYIPPPALPPYPWPPDYEFPAVPPPPPPPPPAYTPPLSPIIGTSNTLKASILGALALIGIVGADVTYGDPPTTKNSLDVMFTAICETMCEHAAYYSIVASGIDTGTGHTHTVS